MDEKDERLLKLLEKNGRIPYVELARDLGISEGAVRKRMGKLVESGAIRQFTIIRAPTTGVRAYVLASIKPVSHLREISEAVAKIPGIKTVHEVSGDFDLICYLEADAPTSLNRTVDRIRGIKGTTKTITAFVLK